MTESAEERFTTLVTSLESLKSSVKGMQDVGAYFEDEHKAASVLLVTLSRAMVLLDPDRTEEYFAGYVEEFLKKQASREESAPTGQYL